MSLHGPAGACIPVASASPIHVFPIQRVLKHCGAHKHIYIYIYIYKTHVIQNNLRTPQLAGFARQLGFKKTISYKPIVHNLCIASTAHVIVTHFMSTEHSKLH